MIKLLILSQQRRNPLAYYIGRAPGSKRLSPGSSINVQYRQSRRKLSLVVTLLFFRSFSAFVTILMEIWNSSSAIFWLKVLVSQYIAFRFVICDELQVGDFILYFEYAEVVVN